MNLPTIKKNDNEHLNSMQVAKMIEKRHDNLVRDIDSYVELLSNSHSSTLRSEKKIDIDDFFIKANYKNARGKIYPCYIISKMGCEFIANKMQGSKGALFTALYVIRFNKMEKIERDKQSIRWQDARKRSKVYADFMNDTIKKLVNYSIAQGQAPEKANFAYTNYNRLINEVAEAYDRDNTDTETQNKLVTIIVAVDTYIKNSMKWNMKYYAIYPNCKDLVNTALNRDRKRLQ